MSRCDVEMVERNDSRCPNKAVDFCADCGEALCKEHIGRELDMTDTVLCKRCTQ